MKLAKKYRGKGGLEKLEKDLDELLLHYSALSNKTGDMYFGGVADGINKAWNLLNGNKDLEELTQ